MLGGANVETLHNAILWKRAGIPFHFTAIGSVHDSTRELADRFSLPWTEYRPGDWDDAVVVGWNNPRYLSELITRTSKPAKALYMNCMTMAHPAETELCRRGLITHVGYVSKHQQKMLEGSHPGAEVLDYTPYFSDHGEAGIEAADRPSRPLTIGHISRDDPYKMPVDVWSWVELAGDVRWRFLGYGPECMAMHGEPPPNVEMIEPMGEDLPSFLSSVDCLWHHPGPAGESMARVVVEAMLSGAIPIAPNAYAFPEFVPEEFLYDSRKSFAEKVSTAGPNRNEDLGLRQKAQSMFSDVGRCSEMWNRILQ
jgi:glycosyltransferase involved in cell wall biosynthesis